MTDRFIDKKISLAALYLKLQDPFHIISEKVGKNYPNKSSFCCYLGSHLGAAASSATKAA